MSKKLVGFLLSIALLSGAIYFSSTVQSPILSMLQQVNILNNSIVSYLKEAIFEHFFQAEHIEMLEEKLKLYEKNHIIAEQLASDVKDLLAQNNINMKIEPDAELIKSISYQKFGDYNRIWLDVKEYDPSKIYGLTYKNFVAGIVIPQDDRALGLLINDIKCSYSVCIGEAMAPGVAHGNNSQNIIIKYIPAWYQIKEGDEVVTSGLDEIFFKNLKVGKVLSVDKSSGYQSAVVEPYYKNIEPSYFYIIRKIY